MLVIPGAILFLRLGKSYLILFKSKMSPICLKNSSREQDRESHEKRTLFQQHLSGLLCLPIPFLRAGICAQAPETAATCDLSLHLPIHLALFPLLYRIDSPLPSTVLAASRCSETLQFPRVDKTGVYILPSISSTHQVCFQVTMRGICSLYPSSSFKCISLTN